MYRAILLFLGALLTLFGLLLFQQAGDKGQPESRSPDPQQRPMASVTHSTEDDERILREAHVSTDGASLLAFLRERSATDEELQNLDHLVRRLGSERFQEREVTATKLIALGARPLPSLKKASADPDPEIAERAKSCVQEIEAGVNYAISRAVVRLLVSRQQAGAVNSLLNYLPSAPTEDSIEEVWWGLEMLISRDRKTHPVLEVALNDARPECRAAAACILGRWGDAGQRSAVRRLLADADAVVRLRAAQGLLAGRDETAIPVLIALLGEESVEISWQAEELLHCAAGRSAPETIVAAATPESCKCCQSAWENWWHVSRTKPQFLDLQHKLRSPGLMLVCALDHVRKQTGRIYLCGRDGKPRWQLPGVTSPLYAQLLPGNRILVAEAGNTNRITERNLQGRVLWQKNLDENLVACRRLPNGNTFVATQRHVMEIAADRSQMYFYDAVRAGLIGIRSAYKLDTGRVLCNSYRRSEDDDLVELDTRSGKTMDLPIQNELRGQYFQIGVSSRGNSLLALRTRVVEINSVGQIVAQFPVEGASYGTLLFNGNLLVTCGKPRERRIAELDPFGRMVWQITPLGSSPFACFPACLPLIRFGFQDLQASLSSSS
jgi:hypothetical protein